jgi:hypothetical protein
VREGVGLLRASHGIPAIKDEERHPIHWIVRASSKPAWTAGVGALRRTRATWRQVSFAASATRESWSKTSLFGDARYAFCGILAASVATQVHHLVGVEGISRDAPLQVIVEPVRGGGSFHVHVHGVRLVLGESVFRHEHVTPIEGRTARRRGVEQVSAVNDLHLIAMGKGREAAFEPALADIAPRTDKVGPDVDAHMGIVARE